mmetsp:Transcript_88176/g.254459  ORF Transcript_88176/g.254459 Transcript_88176/m.254459 type:complete len:211 (+) Transcript_88176:361-993(+)
MLCEKVTVQRRLRRQPLLRHPAERISQKCRRGCRWPCAPRCAQLLRGGEGRPRPAPGDRRLHGEARELRGHVGELAQQEGVENHTHSPHVGAPVIRHIPQHLRGHKRRGAANTVQAMLPAGRCKTKVAELHDPLPAKAQEVVGLHVAMHYVLGVDMGDAREHAFDDRLQCVLIQRRRPLEHLEQRSVALLENDVRKARLHVKIEHPDDIV